MPPDPTLTTERDTALILVRDNLETQETATPATPSTIPRPCGGAAWQRVVCSRIVIDPCVEEEAEDPVRIMAGSGLISHAAPVRVGICSRRR